MMTAILSAGNTNMRLMAIILCLGVIGIIVPKAEAYTISGRLGAVGAGARIEMEGAASASVTADAAGNYIITAVQRGVYRLYVKPEKPNIVWSPEEIAVKAIDFDVEGNLSERNFAAIPAYSIIGKVMAGITPVSGAIVNATLSTDTTRAKTASTSADGTYSIDRVLNGSYLLSVMRLPADYVLSAPYSQSIIVSGTNVTAPTLKALHKSISGKVMAGTLPLNGVPVTAVLTIYSLSGPAVTKSNTVITGVDGTYTFSDLGTTTTDIFGSITSPLSDGLYTIKTSMPGYIITPVSRDTMFNSLNNPQVSGIDFAATPVSISGKVMAGTKPLGGVRVTASLAGTTTSKSAITAADGSYSIAGGIIDGIYNVTAAEGLGYTLTSPSQSITIAGTSATGLNFTATPTTFAISGTVALNGTGTPAAVVTISGGMFYGTSTPKPQRTTDASGNYSFANLKDGTYTLTATYLSQLVTPANQSVTISGADKTGVNFAVTTYSISGMVAAGTTSLPNTTMILSGASSMAAASGANGVYTFGSLLNGSYTIMPGKPGYSFSPASLTASIAGANVGSKNFTGTPLANSISGRVTGKGTGWAGVKVTLTGISVKYSVSTTTDSQGNYAFTGVAIGSYDVTPSFTGAVFTPLNKKVSMTGAGLPNNNFAY